MMVNIVAEYDFELCVMKQVFLNENCATAKESLNLTTSSYSLVPHFTPIV